MVRRRDEETFRQFYREHVGFVASAASLLGLARAQLEDVTQEVFIVAHRKLDPLDAPGTRAWLFATTRNLVRRAQRSEARHARRRAALSQAVRARGGDETCVEAWDARRTVCELLERLGEAQRTTFVGVELLGMSAAELGRALEVSANTVASRLRLARARLGVLARQDGLVEQARRESEPSSRMSSAIWVGLSTRLPSSSVAGVSAGSALKFAAAVTFAAALRPAHPVPVRVAAEVASAGREHANSGAPRRLAVARNADSGTLPTLGVDREPREGTGGVGNALVPRSDGAPHPEEGQRAVDVATSPGKLARTGRTPARTPPSAASTPAEKREPSPEEPAVSEPADAGNEPQAPAPDSRRLSLRARRPPRPDVELGPLHQPSLRPRAQDVLGPSPPSGLVSPAIEHASIDAVPQSTARRPLMPPSVVLPLAAATALRRAVR